MIYGLNYNYDNISTASTIFLSSKSIFNFHKVPTIFLEKSKVPIT